MEHTLAGTIRTHQIHSRFLRTNRDVIVYLPPGYDDEPERRYPVCYLQDGQNLFDAATAFAGNEWGLDETAEELIRSGQMEAIIIVGIYNAGAKRINEYTHVRDSRGRGGRARAYGQMLVRELLPLINSAYRTLIGPQHTALGGSSLGGLLTLYLGLQHREIFGKLIVMSPSVWWARRDILNQVARLEAKTGQSIWLDVGTAEGSDPGRTLRDVEALRDALLKKGWRLGHDLAYREDQGAEHNESAWGRRMREALPFLFPVSVERAA
ncbi:MAG TPA: alpha/beta hydrolase-fold protein [Bryobacteraceae bacterium]|nr:alpha/beta hydrolase-fold protein [Bryobacteraceae bacterium]